jgi:hypothetical protein
MSEANLNHATFTPLANLGRHTPPALVPALFVKPPLPAVLVTPPVFEDPAVTAAPPLLVEPAFPAFPPASGLPPLPGLPAELLAPPAPGFSPSVPLQAASESAQQVSMHDEVSERSNEAAKGMLHRTMVQIGAPDRSVLRVVVGLCKSALRTQD